MQFDQPSITESAGDESAPAPAPRSRRRRWSNDTIAACAVALTLLGVYWLSMGGHTYSVDGESYLAATRALAHGTTVVAPGDDLDGVVVVVPDKDGQTTTIAAPGAVLMYLPGYIVGRVIAAPFPDAHQEEVLRLVFLSANSVFTAITGALIFLLCRALRASTRSSVLIALAYGLGTWAWSHSQTDFSEPTTALFVAAAMLITVRWWGDPNSGRLAAWSGFFIGAAVSTRSSLLLLVPVMLASVIIRPTGDTPVRRWRATMWFAVGGALPGLVVVINSWVKFGSLFDTGYPTMPYDTPVYEGLFGLFLSPGKGLFFYAPICIVSLFALRSAYLAQRRYMITVGIIMIAHLAVYSRFTVWSGENAFGPRYLVPVLPLLVAIPALVIDSGAHWKRGVKVAAVVGFLIPGLLGSVMYFNAVYFAQQPRVAAAVDNPAPTLIQQHLAWNFYPRTSPLMLHFRSIPLLTDNIQDRLTGNGTYPPIPDEYELRIHWYAQQVELDTWWAWWRIKNGPSIVYLMAIVPLAALMLAGRLARRSWRDAATDGEPSPDVLTAHGGGLQ